MRGVRFEAAGIQIDAWESTPINVIQPSQDNVVEADLDGMIVRGSTARSGVGNAEV